MTEAEFAIRFLNAVQKKHQTYFDGLGLGIFKCVKIKGDKIISVQIIKDDLPAEIKSDIRSMFWQQA